MSAKSETTTLLTPPSGFEKQKVFPKPEIKRVRIVGGKSSTLPPQGVAEPEKVSGTADKSGLPKMAVPYQSHFGVGSHINENLYQPDPHSDWGINEESL